MISSALSTGGLENSDGTKFVCHQFRYGAGLFAQVLGYS
jgi:hypothetical protein